MKHQILALLILPTAIVFSSFARAGQDGRGGGLVRINDRLVTFGSLQLEAPLLQNPTVDVPGLAQLASAVQKFPVVDETREHLLAAILPIGKRKYSRVEAKVVGPKLLVELEKKYSSILGRVTVTKGSKPVIAAITFEEETMLLPAFYELAAQNPQDLIGNQAVLFHEAVWVAYPYKFASIASTSEVVDIEVAFERHLRGIASVEFFEKLGVLCGDGSLSTYFLLLDDVRRGLFKAEMNADGTIPLSVFLDPRVLKIKTQYDFGFEAQSVEVRSNSDLMVWIYQLQARFPTSGFVRYLAMKWRQIEFRMHFHKSVVSPESVEFTLANLSLDPNHSSKGFAIYSIVTGGLIASPNAKGLLPLADFEAFKYRFISGSRPYFDVSFGLTPPRPF